MGAEKRITVEVSPATRMTGGASEEERATVTERSRLTRPLGMGSAAAATPDTRMSESANLKGWSNGA
ncbi:hypothetical protein MFU01_46720 [Myxococcus fulvus]|uniref:Uncharacterized protein n=1 Tax=Myxococcus fulvus TaxID=33 RepID=A0A511T649_MYXFU|nr:hypothetical protein MFU01_46720 [Myxococcus fulvus]